MISTDKALAKVTSLKIRRISLTTHSGQSNMRPKIVKLIAGAKVVAVRFDEQR
jgi:hypothetical protein